MKLRAGGLCALAAAMTGCGPAPLPPAAPPANVIVATSTVPGGVPVGAAKWQRELTRQARLEWGLDAPIATFAGQVQQESAWRVDAVSPAGARGLAQFMPATSDWISGAYSALSENDPLNPVWALRALATYDRVLWEASSAVDDCNRAAKMLSAYNGGAKWVARDEALARSRGLDPAVYWGSVETVNAGRAPQFWNENRAYPRLILRKHEPRYVAAGWGRGLCEGFI